MQTGNGRGREALEESSNDQGLLSKARVRTQREHDLSLDADTQHYAAASLGQSPYIALPNVGVIVVQKSGWGC